MGDLVVTKHRRVYSKPSEAGTNEEMEEKTLKSNQDVDAGSMANVCNNGEENHFGQSDSAKSCADTDVMGTDTDATTEVMRQGSKFDKVSDIPKTDGLQELLQLAREFESAEALQGDSAKRSHPQNDGFEEGFSHKQKLESTVIVKLLAYQEDASNRKEDMEVSCSEEARLTSSATEREVSASCSLPEAKSVPSGDQMSLENKDYGQARASVNRQRCRSASLASITVGPSRSQFTIPQPFSLATDKRALAGGRSREAEVGPSQQKAFDDTCLKTPEISKKLSSRLNVAKSIRSESIKHQEDTFKKLMIREVPENRDDDAMSILSIKSCSLAPKAKASRFTSTSSFKFQSDTRAEKRKEYYSKLQERLIAKEEEMNQMQEKAKKEREEEIKLLRRSLTFKAHPIPSFYQEGPAQKVELPRTPTTRARSPNFSRRESHFGGSTRLCNIIKCEADHRSSLSPQKPGKGNNIELLGCDDCSKKSFEGKRLAKSPEKKTAEGDTPSSGCASELLDVEISITGSAMPDIKVKVRDPLIVSSELMMSDDEEKVHMVESKHVISHGGDEVYHDKFASNKTSAVNDSSVRPDCRVRASNVLQGQVNANAGVLLSSSNKTKADNKTPPLVHENSEEIYTKEGNQSTRKQRYKALTPYFRKRESRRNEEQSAANKEMPHVNSNMTVGFE